jgi:pimeloyl-ACP methyl ester carboxylesterase
MRGIIVRLALTCVVALLALSDAAADPDLATFPPPGRLIQVDGRQMHLYCTGSGAPTVVLEDGQGGASLNWTWIQRDVAKTTRVCAYDRPGYGWSDPADAPMDARETSRQLAALLAAADEKAPYLLVGHSLGGAYARLFAAEHRDAMAGLVLVDATHPSYLTDYKAGGFQSPDPNAAATFLASHELLWNVATGLGVVRGNVIIDPNDFPADIAPAMKAFLGSSQRKRIAVREFGFLHDTLVEIGALDNLGNLPVTVIASDRWLDADAALAAQRADFDKRLQRKWLAISTEGKFMIVPGSDHLSLLTKREHAAAVAQAVVAMVAAIRHPVRTAHPHGRNSPSPGEIAR